MSTQKESLLGISPASSAAKIFDANLKFGWYVAPGFAEGTIPMARKRRPSTYFERPAAIRNYGEGIATPSSKSRVARHRGGSKSHGVSWALVLK